MFTYTGDAKGVGLCSDCKDEFIVGDGEVSDGAGISFTFDGFAKDGLILDVNVGGCSLEVVGFF